ncbi:MAG: hypothetical protein LBS31_07765 [Candidatus Adiutrix sp.]|jgi:hypothetical protein|nr:hypothetical protein [Candidatus Adiutrix sp.]
MRKMPKILILTALISLSAVAAASAEMRAFPGFKVTLPDGWTATGKKAGAGPAGPVTIPAPGDQATIRVNVFPPLSGDAASQVESMVRGYKQATPELKAVNSGLGDGGYKFESDAGASSTYFCRLGRNVLIVEVNGRETSAVKSLLDSIKASNVPLAAPAGALETALPPTPVEAEKTAAAETAVSKNTSPDQALETDAAPPAALTAAAAKASAPARPKPPGFTGLELKSPKGWKATEKNESSERRSTTIVLESPSRLTTVHINLAEPEKSPAADELENFVKAYKAKLPWQTSTASNVGDGGYRFTGGPGGSSIYFCRLGPDVLTIQVDGRETPAVLDLLASIKKPGSPDQPAASAAAPAPAAVTASAAQEPAAAAGLGDFFGFKAELPKGWVAAEKTERLPERSSNLVLRSPDGRVALYINLSPPLGGDAAIEVENSVKIYELSLPGQKFVKTNVGDGGYRLISDSGNSTVYFCRLGSDVLTIQVDGRETQAAKSIIDSIKQK